MSTQHHFEAERRKYLDQILQSDHWFKMIVAGAGTGKTHTFKQLLQRNPGENLALTFINNLAEDLAEGLGDLAEVRTFHSYCRKLLHKLPFEGIDAHFHFFPKLDQIITRDAKILRPSFQAQHRSEKDTFHGAFQGLIEHDGRIHFFLERANFYNAVGFDDSVYRVLVCFRRYPEKIPAYQQLILDEYQDFNALEVDFIGLLESKSPTLIVGDDDQAIYDFRHATPDHLRTKARDPSFTIFPLPYCSRCTEVIIQATHSVIQNARDCGLLTDRLDKEFICYIPDKHADNKHYPKIIHAECSVHNKKASYMSMYIENAIREIPQREVDQSLEEEYPLALIVGPSHYLKQINEHLSKQFPNVIYSHRVDMSLKLLDGYLCLLKDEESNLGWRVILELESPDSVPNIVVKSAIKGCDLVDIIDTVFRAEHQQRIGQLRSLKQDPDTLTEVEKAEIEQYLGMSISDLLGYIGKSSNEDSANAEHDLVDQPEAKEGQPVIRLTTYSGCKGLSAGFTFVTGLEDGVFPRSNAQPLEREVCQFIVAMTRTRKQCHLISTRRFASNRCYPSVFLSWIPSHTIERISANKNYFSTLMKIRFNSQTS